MAFILKKFLRTLVTVSQYSPFALFWMAKAFLIDWPLRAWSFRALPDAGVRMGLKHKLSDTVKEFGELTGTVRGHAVRVEPDHPMESRITVGFRNRQDGLYLCLSKPRRRKEKNIVDIETPDRRFNRTFKTRQARQSTAGQIAGNAELIALINAFYGRWIFRLAGFTIGANDITCTFNYGWNFFPYIPAAKLEDLVMELVSVADALDTLGHG